MKQPKNPTIGDVLTEIQRLREDIQASSKPLLTVEEAAEYLGISPKTIRNALSTKAFPVKPVRWGKRVLFRRQDLDQYIAGMGPEGHVREGYSINFEAYPDIASQEHLGNLGHMAIRQNYSDSVNHTINRRGKSNK